eukprot:Em0005g1667a
MPYLSTTPIRKKYNDRLTELYDYPKYSAPSKHGSRYFYFLNKGLQNQSVLYVQSSLQSDPEVFLDPNGLSEDGTTALTSSEFTEDGELVALSLSEKGSDWNTIIVKKVASKENYSEELKWVKFSTIAWTHDNHGFFYELKCPSEAPPHRTAVCNLEFRCTDTVVVALSESRLPDQGSIVESDYTFFWSGKPEGTPQLGGVGFAVSNHFVKFMLQPPQCISSRVMTIQY